MNGGFATLKAKKARLDDLRLANGRSQAALDAWYDIELTYSSNAIEGNTLTRSETAVVLEKGLTVGGKLLKDHLEAVGHKEALDYVRHVSRSNQPVREADIRQIHALVVGRAEPDEGGQYSRHQRQILGSPLVLPSPAEILPLMGDFGQWLVRETALLPAPETAFAAHEKLVTIHPFSDGNGRTARLLMNLLLLKSDYPPIVIGPEHRVAYLDSLQAIQIGGDGEPYSAFMSQRLEASLDHYIEMLQRGLDQ